MYDENPNGDDSDVIDVRDWLGDALLAGMATVPADGAWPPAVLDGKPFPLAAAFLGFLHAVGAGPSRHPEPDPFCTMDEHLRARRLASEMNAEMRRYIIGEDDDEDVLKRAFEGD